jgi:hypothetical protein
MKSSPEQFPSLEGGVNSSQIPLIVSKGLETISLRVPIIGLSVHENHLGRCIHATFEVFHREVARLANWRRIRVQLSRSNKESGTQTFEIIVALLIISHHRWNVLAFNWPRNINRWITEWNSSIWAFSQDRTLF